MATLATKQSVMSVMASGATVCINTACTLVYRKTPIWLQPTQSDTLVTPRIFRMENITGSVCRGGGGGFAVRSQLSSDRQDNVVKDYRLHIPEPSPFSTCKHRAGLLKNFPKKPSGLFFIPHLRDL